MSLADRLGEDVKSALRAGDKDRLGTLRMALAAIKQREVDERTTLDEAGIIAVLEKMIKQRRESVGHFEAGGREDLALRERAEITLLESYLPRPLSDEEVEALVEQAIADAGASSMRDMGKVMAQIKSRAPGRLDLAAVSARVKARLSG